jgi:3-oxoadipate enol-lactonase
MEVSGRAAGGRAGGCGPGVSSIGRAEKNMPYATRGGVRLHWQETGSGEPLLLVMGHRFSSRMWYPVIPVLSRHFRLIWFDNRGTGGSDSPRGVTSIPAIAEDALTVLDTAEVEAAHIYGVSMGGFVVQHLAITAPQRLRSLVLGCSAVLTADKPRPGRAGYFRYWLPPRLSTPLARRYLYGPAQDSGAVARDLLVLAQDQFDPRGLVAQARGMAAYTLTTGQLAAVRAPALVLHGTHDRVIPLAWGEELASALPHARLVTFEGTGHNYLVDATRQADDAVLSFLRDPWRAAGTGNTR